MTYKFLKTPVGNYCNMNEKCKKKKLEFQLVQRTNIVSSHILLAQGNCLLVLANDLVTR